MAPRRCPVCRLAFRVNDPGVGVTVCQGDVYDQAGWPRGGYDVCHTCARAAMPDVPRLKVPIRMPDGWGDWYCSICRQFLREDDPLQALSPALRLAAEDLLDALQLGEHPPGTPDAVVGDHCEEVSGVRHGVHRPCFECWQRWAPVVRDRWERMQIIPKGTPLNALGFNMV